MAEAATQPGVVRSARQEMMDEITAFRTEEVKNEIREGGGDPDVLDAPVDEVKPESIPPEDWAGMSDEAKGIALREEAERKETTVVDPPVVEPKKTKIKVDGQELEVDDEKIREAGIKALQKESAADKRLEEATRLRAEAEASILAARNNERTDPPAGGPTVVEKLTDDNFLSAVKAIQYGSEADAMTALKSLIATAATTGQPEGLTVAQANELLDFREATKWAHDEYKDVLGDPKLKSLFVTEEKRLRAAGDMRPYREIYTDIGSGLREWRTSLSPTPTPTPTPSRLERKATVVNIPTASVRQPAPQPVKEPSPSDIVDKMRTARHQKV